MRARFVAGLVILAALAGLPSLWIFSAAAILVIAWLRIADRGMVAARSREPGAGTFVALTLYAASLAIALLTVRVALGWLELPMRPFEQTGIAPHLARGSLGFYDKSELRLALLELLVLWVLWAVVLAEMWGSLARRGANPPAVHPFGAVFILVLYFAAIELPPYPSSLSLSVAQMAALWIAGLAAYVLVRKLTASHAMALLAAGWLVLSSSAHSAPETALVGLLSYFALRDSPYRRWAMPGVALAISGVALVAASGAGGSWHLAASPSVLMILAGTLVYFGFVLRRVARGRRLSVRQLWLGATLVFALALASLSIDPAWAVAPGIALVLYIAIRMLSMRLHRASGLRTAAARGFVPVVLCLLFNFLFPVDRLNERIASQVTRYEPAREAWYRQCAKSGRCDTASKPSLAASLRAARQ